MGTMNNQDINNSDMMLKFRAGDTYTFALIFHQFYLELSFFSKRILDKPRVAERIVENAIIELWKTHRQFESLLAIKSFLYNAVRDACFQAMDESQKGIKDVNLSAYMWQETSLFMEKEIIRPEVQRKIGYNLIENLPAACRFEIRKYTAPPTPPDRQPNNIG